MKLLRASLLLFAACAFAQQHAHFAALPEPATVAPGGKTLVRVTVQIDSGWHLYSGSSPAGIPISFKLAGTSAAEDLRLLQPKPKRAFDPIQNGDTETYEGEVLFYLELSVRKDAAAGAAEIPISSRYQTCSSTQCVAGKWNETLKLNIDAAAPTAALAIPTGYSEPKPPVAGGAQPSQSQGWGLFMLTAFGFGLASIFTPCVFPMIPITMSYFLNRQSGGKQDSVAQAVVFCLGIVVLFSGIGLATTLILGPAGVKNLGGNPWVNGFIAALFVAFGLSLLGAFEITIPSSILTRLNASSEKGGFGGTLLMGLTFSLSSFACVGPFVGTLLAASVGGGETLRPLLGMMSFAAGLALPFFLLALFPSYLKRMPRSGGWLARVKVVMGFIILAASLKYLANLDATLHWGFLTRDRFLAAWVVLFAMAGLYLLGFVRLEGIKHDENMGLGRLLSGLVLLIFAISLLPGMFGGKLGDLEAYVPEAEQAGAGAGAQSAGLVWMRDDYKGALAKARAEGKLVFVDFTGYSCANCHWMRANILALPEISALLEKFVLVELYTDGTDAASDANAKLEAEKFKSLAQPLYVILQPDETVVATFDHLTHDPAEFRAFLEKGTAPPQSASIASKFSRIEGGALDPAPFKDKVIVVDFWATYCGPCIKEIPSFNKLQKEFAGQGVTVLGVGMDEDGASLVTPFLKKHPMEYPVALGSAAVNEEYKLEALPVTLVIDRTGKLVKRFDGLTPEDELRAAIKASL